MRLSMKRWLCGLSLFSTLALSVPAFAAEAHPILSFDVPGAGTDSGQGTFPVALNAFSEIVGWYVDAGNTSHGFARMVDGTFITFDVPGSVSTAAYAINLEGAIVGPYFD